MKVTNLDLPVMSSWIEDNALRLDSAPYLSGAIEAKVLLDNLTVEKVPLHQVTSGHNGGIYNGPQFVRNYVDDPAYGVPFLTSSSMLLADLSTVGLLRKKDAESPKLNYLRLREGMTLISCSGTIGRMVYTRPDMEGIWSSQDVLKAVPDPDKILPGYLYAYMSSRFGVPLVVFGTYGAVIQHLEPHHIADLPIPIAPQKLQEQVHHLITEAAEQRTEASARRASAIRKLEEANGLLPLIPALVGSLPDISVASSNLLVSRLDALFHSNYHKSALEALLGLPKPRRTSIGEIADEIIEPVRFKRVPIDDPVYGVPFFGTTALMWADPIPTYYLPKKLSGIDQYIVNDKTLLVPRSGQLSGIIGHAVLPHGRVLEGAVTENAIRIVAESPILAGYLFIVLSSEYGLRQLKARAFGSSIPHLDVRMIRETVIPLLPDASFKEIGNIGWSISKSRSKAVELEQQARAIVERWIESDGTSNG